MFPLKNAIEHLGEDPKTDCTPTPTVCDSICLHPKQSKTIFQKNGSGSIGSVRLWLEGDNAVAESFCDLHLRLTWENTSTPAIDAPIGTFFGNEYGWTACELKTLMLGMEYTPHESFYAYNYFPQPFWQSAKVELVNLGDTELSVKKAEISFVNSTQIAYGPAVCGHFCATEYYPKTPNKAETNTKIGEAFGTGLMVYATLTGYDILHGGCEGDVRVFFDGRKSPEIESDGSESWASYGWGFVTPPQSNPFSCYHGKYGVQSDWSETRLTLGDSYFFKKSLRFELEHGECNNGMGCHSGQFFYYLQSSCPALIETDVLRVADVAGLAAHSYTVTGEYTCLPMTSSYANGLQYINFTDKVHEAFTGEVSFTVDILPDNDGVMLMRTSDQALGRHAAQVLIDGVTVAERIWYYDDFNPYCRWLDDSFAIPAIYTAGKSRITVTLKPIAADGKQKAWNHSAFRVYSLFRK